ncbi:MAG: helix-turn-helix transcriptional regulator [Clostridiales bacterium]|nr:helix-turn-helix transcriptional regulator [Clostridiales bacterium]
MQKQVLSLLKQTDGYLSGEEISRQLNFSSASYFLKILKKYTGLTPREIRKRAAF